MKKKSQLDESNYSYSYFQFNDRQAGVSIGFCPNNNKFFYNAYCTETKILKDLFSVEYDFLNDALDNINAEFGEWKLISFDTKKGCQSCVAKKN